MLDPDSTPSNAEKDLFEAKQILMFSVFDKHLLTDMEKTMSESMCMPLMTVNLEGFSGPYKILIQRCLRKEEASSVCYQYCAG